MGNYGDAFSAAVAAELRAHRARNLNKPTIAELVVATGLAKTTVLNYLNGKRDIPSSEFGELCKALGASPRQIVEAAENVANEV